MIRTNAANDENLNETLERVFRHIEESAKGSEAESDLPDCSMTMYVKQQ